jgi:hypothetical protein
MIPHTSANLKRTHWAAAGSPPGGAVLVASRDRDAFQPASHGTTILYPLRGGEVACIGPEEARQRYGVDPDPVPDFTALRGVPRTNCLARLGLRQNVPLNLCDGTGRLVAVRTEAMILRLYRPVATMEVENLAGPWTAPAPCFAHSAATSR